MAERKYKVVGPCGIFGTDGKEVAPGETVTLDPDNREPGATNVQALIDSGHVEEVKSSGGSSSTSRTSSADKDTKDK